jgi:flagellar hook-associated protein 2
MAGLQATGLGSGLDIESMVSQLMAVERRPITQLATREASFQSKLSAFGQLKSALATLQGAANGLKDASKFAATKATAGADAGFTATSTTSAAAGTFAIEVSQLATSQRVASNASTQFVPADGSTTPRTLEIEFGSVKDGAFEGNGSAKTLEFKGSTLEELRDAINGGELGIKASIVDNGNAKQLVLSGNDSGASKAFRIGGDVGLQYDPAAPTGDPSVENIQAAQNAKLKVDGINIERGTNTVSDVLDGVTLTLNKAGNSTLTVTQDTSPARTAIDAFVKAYNDATNTIKSLTNYDATNKKGSALTGDATARGAESALRNAIGGFFGEGGSTRLSDLGITVQKTGGLAIDSSKLDAALKDPARNVTAFFAGGNGAIGFADSLSKKLGTFIDGTGLISGRTEGINASIKSINVQRTILSDRMVGIEKRYRDQFSALDAAIAGMTQTSSFLSSQLANLPGSSNN